MAESDGWGWGWGWGWGGRLAGRGGGVDHLFTEPIPKFVPVTVTMSTEILPFHFQHVQIVPVLVVLGFLHTSSVDFVPVTKRDIELKGDLVDHHHHVVGVTYHPPGSGRGLGGVGGVVIVHIEDMATGGRGPYGDMGNTFGGDTVTDTTLDTLHDVELEDPLQLGLGDPEPFDPILEDRRGVHHTGDRWF